MIKSVHMRKNSSSSWSSLQRGVLVIVILLTVGNLIYIVWQRQKGEVEIESNVVVAPTKKLPDGSSPKPTPIPLTSGAGVYTIGQGKHTGPDITEVVFDPLDVRKGQDLKITIKTSFPTGVTGVSAELQTDNSVKKIDFNLTKGEVINGEWSAILKMEDSVFYKYILQVTATSGKESSKIIVAPRS
jgi:hypothetical protein